MTEEDQLHGMHTAVDCYLSTLLAIANCVGDACPEVGGPYRNRLSRLQSRLAFDSSPEALEESCLAVETELKEYALKTSAYLAEHGAALRSATAALAEIVGSLGQSQDFDCAHDMRSLILRMQSELAAVERSLKEAEVTDPLTGLMNRREMERRIEAHKDAGGQPVLLHFRITGEASDEIVRQVAARLNVQFRYKDLEPLDRHRFYGAVPGTAGSGAIARRTDSALGRRTLSDGHRRARTGRDRSAAIPTGPGQVSPPVGTPPYFVLT